MSYWRKTKTEMTGTGGGRWERRAVAKKTSKKLRRRADKDACKGIATRKVNGAFNKERSK